MSYKYLLFDLDGTLTDPKEGITKCVQYALKHFNIIVEDLDKLTPFIGPPLETSFMEFYGLTKDEATIAIEKYRERFAPLGVFENLPFNGTVEMLSALKEKGVKLGVASSKPEIFVRQICDKFGYTPYFDVLMGSQPDGTLSEKSEVIEKVMELLNVDLNKKDEILMIGDRKFDIIGAKDHGLKSVGIRLGYASEGELENAGADYIVDDMGELTELLLSLI